MQEIANRGLQDQLPPAVRERFDEAVRRGLVTIEQPAVEFDPSEAQRRQALKDGLDMGFAKARIGAADLVLDILEKTGVDVTKGKEALQFAHDLNQRLAPEIEGTSRERGAGEFLGENAPYLLVPGGAGRTVGTAVLKSTGIGAGVGAAQFVDEGESRTNNTLFGGFVGLLSPVAFKALESGLSKIIGGNTQVFTEAGELTEEAIKRIEAAGDSPGNVISLEVERLRRQGVMTPEEAERFNQFKSQGVDPTLAEVTQRADDFQFQQEASKTSGPIRDNLNQANRTLIESGEELARKTGIDTESAFSTGESVLGAIDEKALAVDKKVSAIYERARESSGSEKSIRLLGLTDKLKRELPLSVSRGNIAESLVSQLKSQGIISPTFKVQGRIDANQAEEVRKLLNQLARENPKQAGLVRELKQELDLDVAKAVGGDAFAEARQAHAAFRKQMERVQRTKFDTNTKSTMLDLLEGKIEPDQVFERLVLQKGTSRSGLVLVNRFLTKGDGVQGGTQAWDNLRGETIRWIVKQSGAGKNDLGDPILTGARIDRAMERIGEEKLKVLLRPSELDALKGIQKVLQLKTPVNATALGKGPTAQAISTLARRFPIVRELFDWASDGRNAFRQRQAIDPSQRTRQALEQDLTLPRPVGVVAAGATGEEF